MELLQGLQVTQDGTEYNLDAVFNSIFKSTETVSDLNNLKNGESTTFGNDCSNRPSGVNYGYCICMGREETNWMFQLVFATSSGTLPGGYFIRHKVNTSNWTSWVELAPKYYQNDYSKHYTDALLIDENNKNGEENKPGYVDGSSSNIPSGCAYGARDVKWMLTDNVMVTITGVATSGLSCVWVNNWTPASGWSGWQKTVTNGMFNNNPADTLYINM